MLGASHTKDLRNGSGPSLHVTQHEVGTTECDWVGCGPMTCYPSEAALYTGCPRRSYEVLKCLIFVFQFIRLLERSYF